MCFTTGTPRHRKNHSGTRAASRNPRTVFSVPLCLCVERCSVCQFHQDRVLLLQTCRTRLVDAERLLVEIVPGGGIGARTATHADIAELATAALALQVVDVAELIEHHGVFPDVCERLLFQVSCQCRQISTGIDLALMRDETHRGSSQASLGHGVHVGGMSSRVSDCMSDPMRLQFDA